MSDTIAAISTPQAAGGIGIIRISGSNAIEIAAKVFTPAYIDSITELRGYSAAFGSVGFEGEKIDDAVALVFRAPKSYTGEDVVEISCHGGLFVLQKTLRTIFSAGARAAEPGEFTKRAFLNGKMDLTEAEAVMRIIGAQGEQAAKAAVTALDGALSKKLGEINSVIVGVCAGLGAWVDYPDEDIDELNRGEIREKLSWAKEEIEKLLDRFDSGRAVTEGINTAIVGRPNVGKSALMNMLTGFNRSIVTDIPGTTRDIVEETVRLGDIILRLADTAGIRETDDIVESIGVYMAKEKLEKADLIIAVFDSSTEIGDSDRDILSFCKNKRCIAVINKTDLESRLDESEIRSEMKTVVKISAKTGQGYDELRKAAEAMLGTAEIDPGAAMLATERQRDAAVRAADCLREAIEALDSGLTLDAVNVSTDCAVEALLEITGQKAREAVVDEIFANFCVGK